ncbi:hypothetical protein QMTAC487_01820 [Sphaerotilus sp. FB-3]|nr:hypothetical protein QMTAC487_01820 [Sphaerotilus sp. FB-3]
MATEKVTSTPAAAVPSAFLACAVTVPGVEALTVSEVMATTMLAAAAVVVEPELDPLLELESVLVEQLPEKLTQPASLPPPPQPASKAAAARASALARSAVIVVVMKSIPCLSVDVRLVAALPSRAGSACRRVAVGDDLGRQEDQQLGLVR